MKKWISETWDHLLDELAFFLVGVWVYRKQILAGIIMIPLLCFAYYWIYWAAGCIYTGRAFPQWMYTGYYAVVALAMLAALGILLWGILAAADAVRSHRENRRLGYVRIARDGTIFFDKGEKKEKGEGRC